MLNVDLIESDICEFKTTFVWNQSTHSLASDRPCFPRYVTSIKAVQYTASSDVTTSHEIKDGRIVINSYKLHDEIDHFDLEGGLEVDIASFRPQLLPTASLEHTWERLTFECDVKESVLQLTTNSLLRFKDTNRLILLTGPPGTGKTTLAHALAQRLSIRLNGTFSSTYLLHLPEEALLSQFFGQSAKQIRNIFESISELSSSNTTTLFVLVIDEIESLAGSRSRSGEQGEVHDAVRATNALLRGFDRIKNRNNVLIICTSNLLDSLDSAFVDRCSEKIVVPRPGATAMYDILRHGLQMLVDEEIVSISEHDALPKYDEAVAKFEGDYRTIGMRLRELVDSLHGNDEGPVSARWLGQLPKLALGSYLDMDASCTLTEAVEMIQRYVERLGMVSQNDRATDGQRGTLKIGAKPAVKLADMARTDDTIKNIIAQEISRQLGPLIDQLEEAISEEIRTTLAAKQPHEAGPLEEVDDASLNSRPKKRKRNRRIKAGSQNRLGARTGRQKLDEKP